MNSRNRAPDIDAHYGDGILYDQTYRRRRHDVRFYVELAKQAGGPVLELGVGTGRVAVELARLGIEVVGVDRMRPMLEQARCNVQKLPLSQRRHVQLKQGNIKTVRLRRRFPLVISPFNVFMHLYERADVEATLATVRQHLRPRGVFVFDVLVPNVQALSRDPTRAYKGNVVRKNGRSYAYSEIFRYDPFLQVQIVNMIFEGTHDPTDAFVVPLLHRQFFPAELEALLHYNGFRIHQRWGDFSCGPLTESSESQVIVCLAR